MSVEELIRLAKENDLELTEEEAKLYFEELNKQGELTDDELESVAGASKSPDAKFTYQDNVITPYGNGYISNMIYDTFYGVWYYDVVVPGVGDYMLEERKLSLE